MNIINFVLEFLKLHWSDILVVVAFVLIMTFAWFRLDNKQWVKDCIYALVVKAEKELGSGTGEEKKVFVLDEFYKAIPIILKVFISRKMLEDLIEWGVDKLKEKLKTGVTLEGDYHKSYATPKIETHTILK